MVEIKPGVRVRYRVGKGYGEGRVANVAEGMATIATERGHNLNRKVSQLEPVDASEEQGDKALDATTEQLAEGGVCPG